MSLTVVGVLDAVRVLQDRFSFVAGFQVTGMKGCATSPRMLVDGVGVPELPADQEAQRRRSAAGMQFWSLQMPYRRLSLRPSMAQVMRTSSKGWARNASCT